QHTRQHLRGPPPPEAGRGRATDSNRHVKDPVRHAEGQVNKTKNDLRRPNRWRAGATAPKHTRQQGMKMETMKMQTTSSQNKKLTGSPTRFAFPAPTTRQVSLAGDFNNWDTKAAPMYKGPDGIWRLSVPLGPGRYEYRFYADGVWQDDPTAHQRAANALGTENCVRIVAA